MKKQYWATSLEGPVDPHLLQGLHEAVTRGEVGWLDIDPTPPVPAIAPGINLIFYHVGGNCYIDDGDCDRFPWSKEIDEWGDTEREIDLNDSSTRKIVIGDLLQLMQHADRSTPNASTIGVHLDNVHRLKSDGLARMFNDYLKAVEDAKQEGLIPRTRTVGYIAKNNPEEFRTALDQGLLNAAPLYQIQENATLSQHGDLDGASRIAQEIGRRYHIPVFLKTFGTDVAYKDVHVSQDMTRRMAQLPNISGAAWSANEKKYHPRYFAQGSVV
jgi:hypothetical protein